MQRYFIFCLITNAYIQFTKILVESRVRRIDTEWRSQSVKRNLQEIEELSHKFRKK